MVRADGVVKGHRHIRAKECNARANKFIYGRKEPRRQNAGLVANRGSEMAAAGSRLWIDDQREQRPNHLTPVLAANKVRHFVYGEKEKVRAEAVVEANRHITAKKCKARAKKIMYGRKETLRLNAGLDGNRCIAMASAVSKVWVDDQPEQRPNHVTPVMATNIGRQFVYGKKEKVRADAVEKANRHIRVKECNARAKTFIYG